MTLTTFYDLSCKEVINCHDGRRLGYIEDLSIDTDCGRILSVFVQGRGHFLFPRKKDRLEIPWEKVDRIGDDIILVNCESCEPLCEKPGDTDERKEKRRFF